MFKNINRIVAGFLIAAAILGIFVFFSQPNTPSVLEVHQDQAEQKCTQYRDAETKAIQEAGSLIEEPYVWSCESSDQTQYKQNRANDPARTSTDADLLAQERVAYWTTALGLLTAMGLVALILTLLEAQKASKAAQDAVGVTREIGEKQVRAYLYVASAKVKASHNGITIDGLIKNSGQSPAMNVDVWFNCRWHQDGFGGDTSLKTRIDSVPAGESGSPFSIQIQMLKNKAGELKRVENSFKLRDVTVHFSGHDIFSKPISGHRSFKTGKHYAFGWETFTDLEADTGVLRVPVSDLSDRDQ